MTSQRFPRRAGVSLLRVALTAALVLTAGAAIVGVSATAASPLTIVPSADSYVDSILVAKNFGTSTQFRIDGSPVVQSYLRFDLGSLSGSPSLAILQIYANSA
ncbi:MAG TPA: hypothetical protein VF349_04460, partial [Candidatus Limnocylindrales bacterium]